MFSHSTLYQRFISVLGILRKSLYGHEICEDFPQSGTVLNIFSFQHLLHKHQNLCNLEAQQKKVTSCEILIAIDTYCFICMGYLSYPRVMLQNWRIMVKCYIDFSQDTQKGVNLIAKYINLNYNRKRNQIPLLLHGKK